MAIEQDLEPLLANQQNQLALIFSESDSIDGKSLAILGANIAIIIFINQTAQHLAVWEYVVLYAPYVLSLVLDLLAIWPRRYKSTGIETSQLPEYINLDRTDLLLRMLSNTQAAIVHNESLNRKRMRACLASIILTGLGFLALLLIL